MLKFSPIAFAAFAMAFLALSSVQADILSLYEFNDDELTDSNNNEISVSTDTHADSFSGFYSTRSDVIGSADSGVAPTFHGFVSSANTPDNIEPSVNGYFHEFTNLIVGGEWNIDAITFDYWVNAAPEGGQFTITVYSDRTGTASASEALGSFTYDIVDGANADRQTITINFPDIAPLQNLTAGDETTIRLVFSDNQTIGYVHRIDDVEIRGNLSQSVPEPSSALAIGLISLGFFRRRKH